MAADVLAAYPEARGVFEAGREVLGYDFARVCRDGPPEELNSTRVSQPAIFLHSMAVLEVLGRQRGGRSAPPCGRGLPAAAAAGLSLGEYSALVFAGCLEFEDALRLVGRRGELMQEACDAAEGTMVSVLGLGAERVEAVIEEMRAEDEGLLVGVANYNSPEQVVISGAAAAVTAAESRLREAGAKRTVRLKVAGAYHSELMASATAELEPLLRAVRLSAPRLPFFANVSGKGVEDPEDIREGLIRQVESAVRWHEIVSALLARGIHQAFEIGPGNVIRGLVRTMDRAATVSPVGTCVDLDKLQEKV